MGEVHPSTALSLCTQIHVPVCPIWSQVLGCVHNNCVFITQKPAEQTLLSVSCGSGLLTDKVHLTGFTAVAKLTLNETKYDSTGHSQKQHNTQQEIRNKQQAAELCTFCSNSSGKARCGREHWLLYPWWCHGCVVGILLSLIGSHPVGNQDLDASQIWHLGVICEAWLFVVEVFNQIRIFRLYM